MMQRHFSIALDFTLVEPLIVIAVIGLLVALLHVWNARAAEFAGLADNRAPGVGPVGVAGSGRHYDGYHRMLYRRLGADGILPLG